MGLFALRVGLCELVDAGLLDADPRDGHLRGWQARCRAAAQWGGEGTVAAGDSTLGPNPRGSPLYSSRRAGAAV
jgi:hypothetical protein